MTKPFTQKHFGQKGSSTDDSNSMTKGAVAKMNASPVMQYKGPIRQEKGTATKRKDYATDAEGKVLGIQEYGEGGKESGTYTPTKAAVERVKSGKGELQKPGALDPYKGSVVEGEGGVIRGYKTSSGEFKRFTNPTTRERLTPKQKKELASFEREKSSYNKAQTAKSEYLRKMKSYEGKTKPEPVQKKYKK